MTAEGFISHGLGDWGNPEGELLRENIETVFLYADTIILKKFADILGRADDADKLEVFAARVRQNYNEKLLIWDTEKNIWCYRAWDHPEKIFITQASQALPLYWGMVPEEKTEERLLYGYKARKTVDGEDGKAASSERNAKIKAYCGRYRGMRWMPDL